MMDNTLIVYTSNNADKQHQRELAGDVAGQPGWGFQNGMLHSIGWFSAHQFTLLSLLNVAGRPCERFNMNEQLAKKFDSQEGVLREVLV